MCQRLGRQIRRGGAIVNAQFEITRSGSFGERTFERTTTRTLSLDEVGATKLEVPEGALAQFEI